MSIFFKKKDDIRKAVNYRPISLTPVIYKMMESIVRNQIVEHLVNENFLASRQYGFINRRHNVPASRVH